MFWTKTVAQQYKQSDFSRILGNVDLPSSSERESQGQDSICSKLLHPRQPSWELERVKGSIFYSRNEALTTALTQLLVSSLGKDQSMAIPCFFVTEDNTSPLLHKIWGGGGGRK